MNNLFYDGFNSKLIETAFFEGFLEIPILEAPKEIVIPSVAVPFSKMDKIRNPSEEMLVFYEQDPEFREFVSIPQNYIDELKDIQITLKSLVSMSVIPVFIICPIGLPSSTKGRRWFDMGTSKNGRYLNTKGSGRSVSDFALVHSSEGAFTRSQTRVNGEMVIKLRLNNGGHSQKGMELLDKYGIKYNIVKTYPNGVRVGNIPNHMQKSKKINIGQSWFPKSWTDKDIRRAGEHVAGLKGNRRIPDGKTIYGVYKGVRVGVKRTHGKIATVFPDSDQSSVTRRKHK